MFELMTTAMKRSNVLIVLMLLAASASFMKCGSDPDPEPNAQDEQLKKLSQTWKKTSVTVDGSAPDVSYDNFTLTISGNPGDNTFNFSTAGRPSLSPWPASGTFTFGTDFATVVNRDDDVVFTYSVSATQLSLTFTYPPPSCPTCPGYAGRTTVVNGSWSMTFGL